MKRFFLKKKVSNFNRNPEAKESKANNTVNLMIRQRYKNLGPLTWEQISIGVWFLIAVILWITRDLIAAPGWASLFRDEYLRKKNTYSL